MSNLDRVYQEVSPCDLFSIVFLVSLPDLGFHCAHSVQFLPHPSLVQAASRGASDFDDMAHRRSRQHVIVVLSHPQRSQKCLGQGSTLRHLALTKVVP